MHIKISGENNLSGTTSETGSLVPVRFVSISFDPFLHLFSMTNEPVVFSLFPFCFKFHFVIMAEKTGKELRFSILF